MLKQCQRQLAAQDLRILHLEQEVQCANAKLLISGQIQADKRLQEKDFDEMYREDIDELKENLERKEYLLQFNEQKYNQYEKVLREIILNYNTPEPVKDLLREKIEKQELFVPKDERKISNVVKHNIELQEQIELLRNENNTMRN